MAKSTELTAAERFVIAECMKIAAEDGSIYGAHDNDEQVDALMDSIKSKLSLPST